MKNLNITTYNAITMVSLNLILAEKGIIQREISEELGISAGSVSRLVRGRILLSIDVMYQLCRMAHVQPAEVLQKADNHAKYLNSHGWDIVKHIDHADDRLLVTWENRDVFSRYARASDVFELAVMIHK